MAKKLTDLNSFMEELKKAGKVRYQNQQRVQARNAAAQKAIKEFNEQEVIRVQRTQELMAKSIVSTC